MRTTRFIFLFSFILFLFNGKAHYDYNTGIKDTSVKHCISKKTYSIHVNKVSDENDGDESCVKRKIRPKGVEVIVPDIVRLSFAQKCSYTFLGCAWSETAYVSALYWVSCKRGPPAL